jgi:hypothetical protein
MTTSQRLRAVIFTIALVACIAPLKGYTELTTIASSATDGRHDFDFNIGAWKTHISRLVNPLSGSKTWVQYEGTHVVRKVWDGRANIGVLEIDGPDGHIEALSLRLYNPATHQWSLNFARSTGGTLGVPMYGEFKNGRGEFIDQETYKGRAILVKNVWSDITPNSCRSVWSYSADSGKTWEVNWIAVDTRIPDDASKTL